MILFRKVYRWLLWNVASKLFILFYVRPLYKFKQAPDSQKLPKPPFIVVANHGTFFDPWIVGFYSNYPYSIMINDDGFRGKGISQWYLRNIGGIPKRKGASDFRAMKATLEQLKNKYPVCIFPEGQTTWDGRTQLMYKGMEKLVKKAGCPLVIIKLQGNFLTKPWWAQTTRKGRILLKTTVIDKKEIFSLSTDKIFDHIKNGIYQDDIKDQSNLKYPFSGERLAEGLERLVWICPKCDSEDQLTTIDNSISCSSCGASITIDAHCVVKGLEFHKIKDIRDWMDWHRDVVINKVKTATVDQVLTSGKNVTLQKENSDHLFETIGTGNLMLTTQTLSFRSQSSTEKWDIVDIHDCVIQKKDVVEIRDSSNYYRFVFTKKSPMKWVYYVRYLKGYELFENRGWL